MAQGVANFVDWFIFGGSKCYSIFFSTLDFKIDFSIVLLQISVEHSGNLFWDRM